MSRQFLDPCWENKAGYFHRETALCKLSIAVFAGARIIGKTVMRQVGLSYLPRVRETIADKSVHAFARRKDAGSEKQNHLAQTLPMGAAGFRMFADDADVETLRICGAQEMSTTLRAPYSIEHQMRKSGMPTIEKPEWSRLQERARRRAGKRKTIARRPYRRS